MRLGTCTPCQFGDHKDHYEVIQAAPEGGVGGSRCTCKGECQDNPQSHILRQMKEVLRAFGASAKRGR